MKLFIKDSLSFNTNRFLILDEFEKTRYNVSIEHTTLGQKIEVYEPSGKIIAKIYERGIFSFKTYNILSEYHSVLILANFSKSKPLFYISNLKWFFRGEVLSKNFDILNVDKSVVMSHLARWSSHGYGYEINIFDNKNEILCLCIALCIDTFTLGDIKVEAQLN